MFPSRFDYFDDVRMLTNRTVILPGEPEPTWLRQRAEYARLRDAKRAEARAARATIREQDRAAGQGLVRRFLTVIARS